MFPAPPLRSDIVWRISIKRPMAHIGRFTEDEAHAQINGPDRPFVIDGVVNDEVAARRL